MTLSTSQVNSGIAINLNGVGSNNGQFFQSDIQNVNICGDDIGPSASTEYWFIGILIVNWGAIDVSNVNTYGPHESPGAAGGGVGLYYEGNLALTSYATILNISRSSFNYHVYGLAFGDYWQGVTVDQCNFNGETGTAAINIVGTGGTLVLLTITNSQFNYGGTYQISVSVPFENLTLIGNTISIYNNGSVGVLLGVNVLNSIIIGNEFNVAGGATGTFGIACNGTNGVIQGNVFQDCTTPVDLQGSSSNIGVNLNRYFSTGANINSGAGNQLGVISQ
jgi:hypothetical protein